jgi:hypothetical protein
MGAMKRKVLPARGGKRMAIKPRKRSGEHILNSSVCLGLHG